MDKNKTEDDNQSDSLETLEEPSTIDQSSRAADSSADSNTTATTSEKIKNRKLVKRGIDKLASFNIYLLGFILLIVITGVVTFVSYSRDKSEENKKDQLITEPLSQDVLDQLRQADVRVGDPKQILSVEANAIFAGKVLIRDSLEVAGQLKLGGPLQIPDIIVSGKGTFGQIQGQTLDISGNGTVNGQLTVGQSATIGGNLSVSGALTAGQLAIQTLQVSGNLNLSGHLDAGGGTPGKSNGNALGGGGTASVSGTDTAGTVNVGTGSGPKAGCFVNLTFTRPYGSTPHVVITPVGSSGGGINYYVNRTSSGFSICASNNPPSGRSFAFDYIVID